MTACSPVIGCSLQEAVYHAVPVLGLPLTFEQKLNTHIVTSKRIGRKRIV